MSSNNDLRWIPLTMFQRMKQLQNLNLSGNHLINIDQGKNYKLTVQKLILVKFPPFLTKLDMSHNQLTTMMARRFLAKANSLTTINLSHNQIEVIEPSALSHLQNLEEIDLSYNKLTEVGHKALYGLVRCHEINLEHNLIRSVTSYLCSYIYMFSRSDISPTAFINFGHKTFQNKTINLANNQLAFVMADWVQEIENEAKFCQVQSECGEEVKIQMAENPIYCDCNMQVILLK